MSPSDLEPVFQKVREHESEFPWTDPDGRSSFEVSIPYYFDGDVEEVAELQRLASELVEAELTFSTTT